ncbi:dipeptide epimerase [Natronobacterium gregoryi]|uniref:Dipeptide epimerase n=2 Tax=Natronobacterium gregoryi TaxID=44930 RepID=L0AG00_NATGS|nr:dipeptide epimerase [Natronobacterium gregoryi]AFZ71990.1 enolase superfamily enzyme related to L-alanine-DL-glutamate epimerase [Natronobacterium gregoryi SP2]PLK20844.1 dipeptide epimerase [Natronobacterium gregoryi SP2]SFJ19592.1 L-alanine-DL-glutamate epimerase [Natronobacterium gregoryi]
MTLETSFQRHTLPLEFPFTISRGTATETDVVTVRIEDDEGTVGVGGAGPSAHYGETADTVEAVLPDLLAVVEAVDDPHQLDRIERQMRETVERNPAARCAVSIALHDLVTKRLEVPLYEYWGLDPDDTIETSYTIGIDDTETMKEKTELALERGYTTLKVKLGTDRDLEIVETIRSVAPAEDVRLYVDANEAWTPREAVRKIDELAAYDLEFVEQPVPAEDPEGLEFVYERAALPIAADESCITVEDVPQIAGRCDVANLKLMKCGGLREAKRIIHTARAHGLQVMCGCMNESNASIAAACHLAPLLDYADLDGSLLLDDDPYDGVPMAGGRIALEDLEPAGTGVALE